jgi:hypothetical protein
MSFPLVVLIAVLPGLYALGSWDLDPPGPWWGLRSLAVLDGMVFDQVPDIVQVRPGAEADAYRAVALQPPLYAWLAALGRPDLNPRMAVIPSYLAGAAVVVLAYFHARLWKGPRTAVIAAVLTGFNRHLLSHMQLPAPWTLGLAGTMVVLYGYGRHLHIGAGSGRSWGSSGGGTWGVLTGLALAGSLLAVSGFGLITVPLILLHLAYLRAGSPPGERPPHWWLAWRGHPSLLAGILAMLVAVLLTAPWYGMMLSRYGGDFTLALVNPPNPPGVDRMGLLTRLIDLSPATLPLGIFAAIRALKRALTAEDDERDAVGGALWVIWLGVAALAPAFWPNGPRPTMGLFLLIPLNLLAAQGMTDLASRRAPVRSLLWLAPATAVCIAWWASGTLRAAAIGLARGQASSATALGLHLALDLTLVVVILTRVLDRWARRRDDRQRAVIGVFLGLVVLITVASGIREVEFRHRETRDLLQLREAVLRLHQSKPFNLVAVVGPDALSVANEGPAPGGRLDFILRSALPNVERRNLDSADELLTLPDTRRLVVLVGTEQRLSYAVQARLGLEAIAQSKEGVLVAFASTNPDRSHPVGSPATTLDIEP